MKKPLSLALLAFLTIAACKRDKIDFDMLDDIRFSPEMQIPLVKAHLTLNDLVKEDSILTVDPDGGLRIVYSQDSLFGFGAIDFVKIPEQAPILMALEVGQPAFELGIGLGTLGGVELANAIFDKGKLKYNLTTTTPVNGDVEFAITIANATLNGNTFVHTFTLPSGVTQFEDSVDISHIEFDLSNNGTAINFLGLKAEITDPGNAPSGQNFAVGVQLSGLEVSEAHGYFGQKVINIPNGQFDFDISGLSEFTEGFYLTNPSIKLITASSLGLGLQFAPNFFGVNEKGKVVSLDATKYEITQANSSATMDTTIISIDASNSSIVEFLANLPKVITYGGNGKLNPSGPVGNNFINKNSRISIGLEIDIPLEVRAQNMRIEQVIEDIKLGSSDNSEAIESLALFFKAENGFPFDVDLSVAFLDSISGDSLDGVNIPLLNAAPVDANGKVTQKTTSSYDVVFTDDHIDALLRSDKIRLTGRLNTTNSGQDAVKLFTDYNLDVKIATKTKVNYKL